MSSPQTNTQETIVQGELIVMEVTIVIEVCQGHEIYFRLKLLFFRLATLVQEQVTFLTLIPYTNAPKTQENTGV